MRKSRFTEEQIIKVLKEHAAGLSAGRSKWEQIRETARSPRTFMCRTITRWAGLERK